MFKKSLMKRESKRVEKAQDAVSRGVPEVRDSRTSVQMVQAIVAVSNFSSFGFMSFAKPEVALQNDVTVIFLANKVTSSFCSRSDSERTIII